jgi:hypothetical protein
MSVDFQRTTRHYIPQDRTFDRCIFETYSWERVRNKSQETESEDFDWIYLTKDKSQLWAVVNTIMNLRVT